MQTPGVVRLLQRKAEQEKVAREGKQKGFAFLVWVCQLG